MTKLAVKALLGLVFFSLISIKGFSQVRLGFKGGFNVSKALWTTANPLSKPIIRAGLHGGGFAEIPINNKLFLRPELMFSVKGWTNPAVERDTFRIKGSSVNLLYLSIPVLAGYQISEKFALLAGPELSILLKARTIPGGLSDRTDFYKGQDLGIAIGTAYRISDKMAIEARYVYGFLALDKWNKSNGQQIKDGYNRLLQLSVNYVIHQALD